MKFVSGVFQTEDAICSPAAAVPASAKIPVPMIAPMPMQVSANGPRTRFNCRLGAAASAIKWSGLFLRKRSSDIVSFKESCHPDLLVVNHKFESRSWPVNRKKSPDHL